MAIADLTFAHTHMFMCTKHVPQPFCGFVVIIVVAPDGSTLAIFDVFKQENKKNLS